MTSSNAAFGEDLRARLLAVVFAVSCVATLPGCGGPPFNSYEHPPTFAFKMSASDPRMYSQYSGSLLQGVLLADRIGTSFYPTGDVRQFQTWASFGQWVTVQGARWPALWQLTSTWGCGVGTSANVDVTQKIFEFACVPRTSYLSVLPSSYQQTGPPPSLTVSFDASAVPTGTLVRVWVVDSGVTTILAGPEERFVDASGAVSIPTPTLTVGHYYVAAEAPDLVGSLDGALGGFDVVAGVSSPMQANSAVRNCSGYHDWGSVYKPDAATCYSYCAANGANACEWEQSSGGCWVEFGSGCSVQAGFQGWWAAVLSSPQPQPSAPPLQNSSAVRGCGLSWWDPIYKPDPQSCSNHCAQNGANACEWE